MLHGTGSKQSAQLGAGRRAACLRSWEEGVCQQAGRLAQQKDLHKGPGAAGEAGYGTTRQAGTAASTCCQRCMSFTKGFQRMQPLSAPWPSPLTTVASVTGLPLHCSCQSMWAGCREQPNKVHFLLDFGLVSNLHSNAQLQPLAANPAWAGQQQEALLPAPLVLLCTAVQPLPPAAHPLPPPGHGAAHRPSPGPRGTSPCWLAAREGRLR